MRIIIIVFVAFTWVCSFSQTTQERLGIQFFENNEYEKAEAIFKKIYQQNTPSIYVYEYYLNTLIALKKQREAEKVVEYRIKKYPSDIALQVDLGFVIDRFGETEKANRFFDKISKSSTENIYEIKVLANGFQRRGYPEKAIELYQLGIKKHGHLPFYVELIYVYRSTLKTKELADFSINLIQQEPSTYTYVNRSLITVFEEPEAVEHLRQIILKIIQKKPDNVMLNELLLECFIHQKKYASAFKQVKYIDRLSNAQGKRVLDLGDLCLQNHVFKEAIDAYYYIIDLGKNNPYYLDGQNGLIRALYQQISLSIQPDSSELSTLTLKIQELINQEGLTYKTVSSIYHLAEINLFYLKKPEETCILLKKIIETPRLQPGFVAKCKLLLGDASLVQGLEWEARLLYGQVEKQFKEDALGQEARFKSAKLSYYMGDFEWAQSQLDVLKMATTQLISNNAMELSLLIQDNIGLDSTNQALTDYAKADFLLFQNKVNACNEVLNLLPFKYPNHSLNDEIYFLKARVQEQLGDFQKAKSLYTVVYQKYPNDILADNALFRAGVISIQILKDQKEAKQLFEQLVFNYSGSLYVTEARKQYLKLKNE